MKEHEHPYWNKKNFPNTSKENLAKGTKLAGRGGNYWGEYKEHLEKVVEENKDK